MEDPHVFDVWGVIIRERRDAARDLLRRSRPELPRLELLQIVARGVASQEHVLVAQRVGWGEAQEWRREAESAFSPIGVFQSGYGPRDAQRMHQCKEHGLFYGGILGCPVCRHHYVP
jgi:hypothetical protein